MQLTQCEKNREAKRRSRYRSVCAGPSFDWPSFGTCLGKAGQPYSVQLVPKSYKFRAAIGCNWIIAMYCMSALALHGTAWPPTGPLSETAKVWPGCQMASVEGALTAFGKRNTQTPKRNRT